MYVSFVMERMTNDFQNSQMFSFLSRVILTNWENPLLNYDQIYKVRQRFYNTKVLQVVRLIEIQILKRALAQTVHA